MGIYRKIAILFIFILFSYILLRLVLQRIEIRKQIEGFTPEDSNVLSIQKENSIPPNLQNMNTNYYSKQLGDVYIKSAYGGAFDGVDTCADMMNYTLSLGYRYVIIHVFYDVVNTGTNSTSGPKTAMVGFSSTFSPMSNTANKTMAFVDLLNIILQNAFSSTSPNPGDPFFLHILPAYQSLVNTDKSMNPEAIGNNSQLNTQIEQALMVLQGSNRLANNITTKSSLGQLKGKLVITMDAESTQGNMTPNLKSIIGFSVPTSSLQSVKKLKQPSANQWSVVLPIDTDLALLTNNSDYVNTYKTYKMNVSPVCMWTTRSILSTFGSMSGTTNLGDYESMFANEGSSAFIILS